MKKGLFIGRFQPFHHGHLSAVQQALVQCDFLTIGIGSSQYNRTEENPFTFEEREKIIRVSLKEAEITEERFHLLALPDIHDNARWPGHVKSLAGDFDTLFMSNTGIVKELFEKYAPETPIVLLKEEIPISATRIRQKIARKEDWQKDISPAAVKLIGALTP